MIARWMLLGAAWGAACTYLYTIKYHHSTKLQQADMQKLNVSYVAPTVWCRFSTIRSLGPWLCRAICCWEYLSIYCMWRQSGTGLGTILCFPMVLVTLLLNWSLLVKKIKNTSAIFVASRFAMTNGWLLVSKSPIFFREIRERFTDCTNRPGGVVHSLLS